MMVHSLIGIKVPASVPSNVINEMLIMGCMAKGLHIPYTLNNHRRGEDTPRRILILRLRPVELRPLHSKDFPLILLLYLFVDLRQSKDLYSKKRESLSNTPDS